MLTANQQPIAKHAQNPQAAKSHFDDGHCRCATA